ncbi:hypothetical protein C8Q73DRAFT_70471 [Cubamyces lactineus]|nr:hypothetical protein C8Q73DRAFT_70471 [Cubamyces lactineus]
MGLCLQDSPSRLHLIAPYHALISPTSNMHLTIEDLVSGVIQAIALKQFTIGTLCIDLCRSVLLSILSGVGILFGKGSIVNAIQHDVVDNYFQANGTVIHHYYVHEHRFPQLTLLLWAFGAIGLLVVLGAARHFLRYHNEPRTPATDLVHGGGRLPAALSGNKMKTLVYDIFRRARGRTTGNDSYSSTHMSDSSTGGSGLRLPWSTKATSLLMESPWSAVAARTTRERRSGPKKRTASSISSTTTRFTRRRAIASTADANPCASRASSTFEYDIVDPCAQPIRGWFDYYDDNSPGWLLPVIEHLSTSGSRRNSFAHLSEPRDASSPRSSFSHFAPTFSSIAIHSDADACADLSYSSGLMHAGDHKSTNTDGPSDGSHEETGDRHLSREPLYWNPPPSAEPGQWAYPSPFAFSGMAVDANLFAAGTGTYPGSELMAPTDN